MENNELSVPNLTRPQAPFAIGLPGMSLSSGLRQTGANSAATATSVHGETPPPSGLVPEHLTLSRTTGPRGKVNICLDFLLASALGMSLLCKTLHIGANSL